MLKIQQIADNKQLVKVNENKYKNSEKNIYAYLSSINPSQSVPERFCS